MAAATLRGPRCARAPQGDGHNVEGDSSVARTDAIVLGAGIVGTSVALQLAKRGLSVALVDRAGVGEATSYGNSGVIEGSTILPPAFPSSLWALARVALKRASDANYHWSYLPKVAPWLLAFRANSTPRAPGGKRAGKPAAVCARARRARDADAGIRRRALFAQDRLDEALSRRRAPSRRCSPNSISPRNSACRSMRSMPLARRSWNLRSTRCSSARCSGRRRRASAIRWRSRAPMPRALPRSAA